MVVAFRGWVEIVRTAHRRGLDGRDVLRLTGANSSTGHRAFDRDRMVDAAPTATDDRRNTVEAARNFRSPGAEVNEHGAARIADREAPGALESAPMVTFSFDGVPVEGREGEPIAVSLLAAGRRIFRTMTRFGDSRGGYCMVGRCADCLVVVDGASNVRACVAPVAAGLEVRTQHGLGRDDQTVSRTPRR